MPDFSIWCYLWDLVDEGIERVIGGLRDNLGLDAISVATSYHSFEQLRPGFVRPKWMIVHDAALYFPANLGCWADTPIKPRISPWLAGRDPLQAVAAACRKHGVKLRSWTVFLHNSHLGRAHPDATIHSPWGDPHPEALCPANPQVRAYARALATALAERDAFDAIEAELLHYAPEHHHHGHAKLGILPGLVEELCLGLCYCDHCRAAALERGIDFVGLRDMAQSRVQAQLDSGNPTEQPLDEWIQTTRGMAEFIAMRKEIVTSLVREVRQRCAKARFNFYDAGGWISGALDLGQITPIVDEVTILAYDPSAEQVATAIGQARAAMGGSVAKLRVGLQPYKPASPDAATLIRSVRVARRAGVGRFAFYNYGIMPRASLDWVGQAIAAGRR